MKKIIFGCVLFVSGLFGIIKVIELSIRNHTEYTRYGSDFVKEPFLLFLVVITLSGLIINIHELLKDKKN